MIKQVKEMYESRILLLEQSKTKLQRENLNMQAQLEENLDKIKVLQDDYALLTKLIKKLKKN